MYSRARGFHGTFGENNRQVIARDPTLTHSLYSVPLSPVLSRSFQSSDTRPETPHLAFSPQFFRHICFCLATTMHRLHRYDIKICAAMYLLLSLFLHCTCAPFSPVLLLISLFPVCRHVTGKISPFIVLPVRKIIFQPKTASPSSLEKSSSF